MLDSADLVFGIGDLSHAPSAATRRINFFPLPRRTIASRPLSRAHSRLNARTTAAGAAAVSYRPAFRFDLVKSRAAFHFHDLIAQQSRAFKFEIGRSLLHFLLQFPQQLGHVKIAACLAN